MSVELVTGYSGVGSSGEPNRHVSSAEDGARQAGTLGLGCYALSTGSKLSATMEDANTLVVADGDVVMNGRHVRLTETTSFTIPTGVQGQKVSNIAVLRYQVGADSVESVTPVVLTGEPSTGEPTDPAYNEGSILDGDSPVDFPLYRVVTDGINAGDPEPLFDVLMPMADLWDSVSHMPKLLWSGSLKFSGEIVATGLSVYSLMAVEFDGYMVGFASTSAAFVSAMGSQKNESYMKRGYSAIITVSGDAIYVSSVIFSSYSSSLGQPLTLVAGDEANITKVWGVA